MYLQEAECPTLAKQSNATNTTLELGHLVVKHHFHQRHIIHLKAPKARITGQQSMDHT
jgi:hypothetical protein